MNEHNQVGMAAVVLFGEPIDQPEENNNKYDVLQSTTTALDEEDKSSEFVPNVIANDAEVNKNEEGHIDGASVLDDDDNSIRTKVNAVGPPILESPCIAEDIQDPAKLGSYSMDAGDTMEKEKGKFKRSSSYDALLTEKDPNFQEGSSNIDEIDAQLVQEEEKPLSQLYKERKNIKSREKKASVQVVFDNSRTDASMNESNAQPQMQPPRPPSQPKQQMFQPVPLPTRQKTPEKKTLQFLPPPIQKLQYNKKYVNLYYKLDKALVLTEEYKEESVNNEDYKSAARFKGVENKILESISILESLEILKSEKVKYEDFDSAQVILEMISSLTRYLNKEPSTLLKTITNDLYGYEAIQIQHTRPKSSYDMSVEEPLKGVDIPRSKLGQQASGADNEEGEENQQNVEENEDTKEDEEIGPNSIPSFAKKRSASSFPAYGDRLGSAGREIKELSGKEKDMYVLSKEEKEEMERQFAERAKKIKADLRKKRKQAQDKNRLGLNAKEMEERIQQRAREALKSIKGELPDKSPGNNKGPSGRSESVNVGATSRKLSMPLTPIIKQKTQPTSKNIVLKDLQPDVEIPEMDVSTRNSTDVIEILKFFPEMTVRAIMTKKPTNIKQVVIYVTRCLEHLRAGGDIHLIEDLSQHVLDEPEKAHKSCLHSSIYVYIYVYRVGLDVYLKMLSDLVQCFMKDQELTSEDVKHLATAAANRGFTEPIKEQLLMLAQFDADLVAKVVSNVQITSNKSDPKLQKQLEYRGDLLHKIIQQYGLKSRHDARTKSVDVNSLVPFIQVCLDCAVKQEVKDAVFNLLVEIYKQLSDGVSWITKLTNGHTDTPFMRKLEKLLAQADATEGRKVQLMLDRDNTSFIPASDILPAHLSKIVSAVQSNKDAKNDANRKQNAIQLASASSPMNNDDVDDGDGLEPGICGFCFWEPPKGLSNAETVKALKRHILVDCACCLPCPACERIVEIPCLPEHMVVECVANHVPNASRHFSLCPKCRLAFPDEDIASHITKCKVSIDEESILCPLCGVILKDGDEALAHYADPPYCPKNPRTPGNRVQ